HLRAAEQQVGQAARRRGGQGRIGRQRHGGGGRRNGEARIVSGNQRGGAGGARRPDLARAGRQQAGRGAVGDRDHRGGGRVVRQRGLDRQGDIGRVAHQEDAHQHDERRDAAADR